MIREQINKETGSIIYAIDGIPTGPMATVWADQYGAFSVYFHGKIGQTIQTLDGIPTLKGAQKIARQWVKAHIGR
jgi:hypothetical protein